MSLVRHVAMTGWYRWARILTSLEPSITVDGVSLAVFPGVYKPLENEHAIARFCRAGDRVLDLGCGCGVIAVFAARVAREVVAVDISAVAIENTRANVQALGLINVRVKRSDMFRDVDGRFDVILANPPYNHDARDRDDEQFATSTRFLPALFENAREHLTDRGRLVVQFPARGERVITDHAVRHRLRLLRAERMPKKSLRLAIAGAAYLQAGLRSTWFVLEP